MREESDKKKNEMWNGECLVIELGKVVVSALKDDRHRLRTRVIATIGDNACYIASCSFILFDRKINPV